MDIAAAIDSEWNVFEPTTIWLGYTPVCCKNFSFITRCLSRARHRMFVTAIQRHRHIINYSTPTYWLFRNAFLALPYAGYTYDISVNALMMKENQDEKRTFPGRRMRM